MNQENKKRLLLTGASSFLGSSLLQKLDENFHVTLLQHKKVLSPKNNHEIIHGGLENIADLEDKLSEIDTVLHLAAITHTKDQDLYEKINTLGTNNLVEASKRHGVKQFIFISTRAIGPNCGAYGESKKMAEEYLKDSGVPYTILRVAEAWDEDFSKAEGLGSLLKIVQMSSVVPYISLKSELAPIHKDDVVSGILKTLNNPKTFYKTYTLAGPENLSMKEIIERIAKSKKVKRILIPIPETLAKIVFYLTSLMKITPQDQLQRLLCEKEPLSKNVLEDLDLNPKIFLTP